MAVRTHHSPSDSTAKYDLSNHPMYSPSLFLANNIDSSSYASSSSSSSSSMPTSPKHQCLDAQMQLDTSRPVYNLNNHPEYPPGLEPTLTQFGFPYPLSQSPISDSATLVFWERDFNLQKDSQNYDFSPASAPHPILPNPYSRRSSLSLDPHAIPFIPNFQMHESAPLYVNEISQIDQFPMQQQQQQIIETPIPIPYSHLLFPDPERDPVWRSAFYDGVTPGICPQEQNVHAHVLASFSRWEPEDMIILCRYFCRKSTEGIAEKNDPLAPFALALYRKLLLVRGKSVAQQFMKELNVMACNQFVDFWSPNLPTSAFQNPVTWEQISANICIGAFIADLFAMDMVPQKHLATCLQGILFYLSTVEQLMCVKEIIKHAGVKYWQKTPCSFFALESFHNEFKQALSKIRIDASLLGTPIERRLFDDIIQGILTPVRGWIAMWGIA
ncbi:hypothetical protein BDQ12DRAFT_745963 [Crucibulum laeve]|uniref:Uncharacterized protein n=1 Tax=Crucibulum laeve TaxID=68775 RepID=A0A5C3M100_9AGAR|nr:hypothetical protein BDQ12DRAFT_745963 [Crucibulum laeve]